MAEISGGGDSTPVPKPQPRPSDGPGVTWFEVLKVVAIPLVTLILGFVLNASLNSRQRRDNNVRLYTEMMGRREESDSALRKDMFNLILGTFMSKDPKLTRYQQLDQEVLSLELLAYNFHESLDVGPLFKHVRQRIEREPDTQSYTAMLSRLQDVTLAVVERQLASLSDTGAVERGDVALTMATNEAVNADIEGASLSNVSVNTTAFFGRHAVSDSSDDPGLPETGISRVCLPLESTDGGPHYRQFGLQIIKYDSTARELYVVLYVTRVLDSNECRRTDLSPETTSEAKAEFWLGMFDLPMIDNIHLTHGERAAVSLTRLTENAAQLAISYFPGSRASLKEKPYYDDLVHDLIRNEQLSEGSRH